MLNTSRVTAALLVLATAVTGGPSPALALRQQPPGESSGAAPLRSQIVEAGREEGAAAGLEETPAEQVKSWLVGQIRARFAKSKRGLLRELSVPDDPAAIFSIGELADEVLVRIETADGSVAVSVGRNADHFPTYSTTFESGVVNDLLRKALKQFGGSWDPKVGTAEPMNKFHFLKMYRWTPPAPDKKKPGGLEEPIEQAAEEIRQAAPRLGVERTLPQWRGVDASGLHSAHNPLVLTIQWAPANAIDVPAALARLELELPGIRTVYPSAYLSFADDYVAIALFRKTWAIRDALAGELAGKKMAIVLGDSPSGDFVTLEEAQAGLVTIPFVQVAVRGEGAPLPAGYPNVVRAERGGRGVDQILGRLLAASEGDRYERIFGPDAAFLPPELLAQPVRLQELVIFSDIDGTLMGAPTTFDESQAGVDGQVARPERRDSIIELARRGVDFRFNSGKTAQDITGRRVRSDEQRILVPLAAGLLRAGVSPQRIGYDGASGGQRGRFTPEGQLRWSRVDFPGGPFSDQEAARLFGRMLQAVEAGAKRGGGMEEFPSKEDLERRFFVETGGADPAALARIAAFIWDNFKTVDLQTNAVLLQVNPLVRRLGAENLLAHVKERGIETPLTLAALATLAAGTGIDEEWLRAHLNPLLFACTRDSRLILNLDFERPGLYHGGSYSPEAMRLDSYEVGESSLQFFSFSPLAAAVFPLFNRGQRRGERQNWLYEFDPDALLAAGFPLEPDPGWALSVATPSYSFGWSTQPVDNRLPQTPVQFDSPDAADRVLQIGKNTYRFVPAGPAEQLQRAPDSAPLFTLRSLASGAEYAFTKGDFKLERGRTIELDGGQLVRLRQAREGGARALSDRFLLTPMLTVDSDEGYLFQDGLLRAVSNIPASPYARDEYYVVGSGKPSDRAVAGVLRLLLRTRDDGGGRRLAARAAAYEIGADVSALVEGQRRLAQARDAETQAREIAAEQFLDDLDSGLEEAALLRVRERIDGFRSALDSRWVAVVGQTVASQYPGLRILAAEWSGRVLLDEGDPAETLRRARAAGGSIHFYGDDQELARLEPLAAGAGVPLVPHDPAGQLFFLLVREILENLGLPVEMLEAVIDFADDLELLGESA